MKRLYYFLISVLAVFAVASCDNGESADIDAIKTLKIVGSQLLFSPDAVNEGYIQYEAVDPVSARSDKEWCSVSVNASENKVLVSVTGNPSNESRYARITLNSGNESLSLTAQQLGEVLDGLDIESVTAPYEGTELVYPIKSNLQMTVQSNQEWIKAVLEKDKELGDLLRITVDKNPAARVRVGSISFSAGFQSGTIDVLQYPPIVRETRWELNVEEGSFVYPHQVNNVTVKAGSEIADEKYAVAVVSKSDVVTSVEDYIFDVFAVEAKKTIDAQLAEGAIHSFEEGLQAGDYSFTVEDLPGSVYVLLVGYDETGYVTGLYQWAEVSVKDKLPIYFKWAGTWKITGREVPYSGATWTQPEEWTITIDEDAIERTLTVRGINSMTQSVVTEYDAATFKFTYNEDGSISLLSQLGPTFPYSTYGDSNLMPQGSYSKNGGSSYSRVSSMGYVIFTATMSDDLSKASIKPGIRNSGGVDYEYEAFRLYLIAGNGSTYTLGGSSGVIPLPFEMTKIK